MIAGMCGMGEVDKLSGSWGWSSALFVRACVCAGGGGVKNRGALGSVGRQLGSHHGTWGRCLL